jgi:hypothetical protein
MHIIKAAKELLVLKSSMDDFGMKKRNVLQDGAQFRLHQIVDCFHQCVIIRRGR